MNLENLFGTNFQLEKIGRNSAKVVDTNGKYITFQKNGYVSIKTLKYPTPTNSIIKKSIQEKTTLLYVLTKVYYNLLQSNWRIFQLKKHLLDTQQPTLKNHSIAL
ncbi:hypothetical protein ACFQZF_06765 [Flavobacterium myungsuense]|uniref:hypothetical protein n=1 Tax=Flavobacterium myungsuense TaxID=651823 RepID=UPI0036447742